MIGQIVVNALRGIKNVASSSTQKGTKIDRSDVMVIVITLAVLALGALGLAFALAPYQQYIPTEYYGI
jgi:hypothetical protein